MLLRRRSRGHMPSRVRRGVFSRRDKLMPLLLFQIPRPGWRWGTRGSTTAPCGLWTSNHHFPTQIVSRVFGHLTATELERSLPQKSGSYRVRRQGQTASPVFPLPQTRQRSRIRSPTRSIRMAVNTSLVPGSFAGTFTAGPRLNQTFTIDLPAFVGFPSSNNMTIVLAEPAPTVETVTYSNGDVWPRICHRSRVLIFLGGQ
jgi:hypothetical protein